MRRLPSGCRRPDDEHRIPHAGLAALNYVGALATVTMLFPAVRERGCLRSSPRRRYHTNRLAALGYTISFAKFPA
jgi:hypothetical protein